ncbi:hypothetical protein C2R22_06435 [Salinigranum rubrum]|uniref:Uncharacterized protein n=1 Tax=Salinigranum rubrum TaxID=755307 RepID=A0A2I8VHC6_9EURY|nr:hypothetical protein [Salinigranum rubrum]AUV81343.1 hypothetical protein C2R22_06435 [Salinigranum rubrum]
MSEPDVAPASDTSEATDLDAPAPTVSALHASPNRLVLTEDGNTDGWLASDATVGLDEIR